MISMIDINQVLGWLVLVPGEGKFWYFYFSTDFSRRNIAQLPGGYAVVACQEHYGCFFPRLHFDGEMPGNFLVGQPAGISIALFSVRR